MSFLSALVSSDWRAQLLPASWRGLPFGVLSASIRPGRGTAVHTYPYRESTAAAPSVWVEDTGAASRPFEFSGFLVDRDPVAGGAPVFAQRDAMIQACLRQGIGVLVHPSLGTRTVALAEPPEMVERLDMGGAIELRFRFVESASGPLFPTAQAQTGAGVANAAAAADAASSQSLGDKLLGAAGSAFNQATSGFSVIPSFSSIDSIGGAVGALNATGSAIGQTVATVSGWASQAQQLISLPARILGAARGIAGVFGRYAGGNLSAAQNPTTTLSSALAGATIARSQVTAAAATAQSLAAGL